MNETKNAQITEILSSAGGRLISVYFTKKDGSIRQLTFNKKDIRGIKGEDASMSAQQAVETRKANNPGLINVRDAALARKAKLEGLPEASAWRSFHTDTVVMVKANGTTYTFAE